MIHTANLSHINKIISLLEENELPVSDISIKHQQFWVLEEKDELIAVGGIEIYGECGLIRSLAVRKNAQNQGYGKSIYQHVLKECKKLGLKTLFLLTTTANKYFEKHGWNAITRMDVPAEVQKSEEFTSICPQSAISMMLPLDKQ